MGHHIDARRRGALSHLRGAPEPDAETRVLVGTDLRVDSTRGTQGGILMKRTLLATVAAAALVAGTIAVAAQGGGAGGAGGAGGGGMGGGGAPSAAPAEKMGSPKGGATTGQATGSQMDRGSGGQTQMDRGQGQGERAGERAGERGESGTTQNRDQQQPRTGQGQNGKQTGQGGQDGARQGQGTNQKTGQGQSGTGSASLNTEQRTKIRETVFKGGSVNRVSNVNFNINVGTVVPRSVHLVTVPSTIVEVHPAWRGYMYFVVNDEIIIVEPGTLRIVAVIS
jgi:hypothetical protein